MRKPTLVPSVLVFKSLHLKGTLRGQYQTKGTFPKVVKAIGHLVKYFRNVVPYVELLHFRG